MRDKLEALRDEIERARRLPLLQKAMQAEAIAERSLDLLEAVVYGAENLNKRLNKFEHDYFGTSATFEGCGGCKNERG
jgi:hypothetical protein